MTSLAAVTASSGNDVLLGIGTFGTPSRHALRLCSGSVGSVGGLQNHWSRAGLDRCSAVFRQWISVDVLYVFRV
jgi:hypothetical protein